MGTTRSTFAHPDFLRLELFELAINITSMVFTVLGALISAVALLLGYLGYRNVRANQIESIRPYLVASYRVEGEPTAEQSVFLEISNHGKTAARDVFLEFEPEGGWRDSSGNRYPFLRQNHGISSIAPGEKGSYFVGKLTSQSKLQSLRDNYVSVTFNYTALANEMEFIELDRISFMDLANSQRLVPDRRRTSTKNESNKSKAIKTTTPKSPIAKKVIK